MKDREVLRNAILSLVWIALFAYCAQRVLDGYLLYAVTLVALVSFAFAALRPLVLRLSMPDMDEKIDVFIHPKLMELYDSVPILVALITMMGLVTLGYVVIALHVGWEWPVMTTSIMGGQNQFAHTSRAYQRHVMMK